MIKEKNAKVGQDKKDFKSLKGLFAPVQSSRNDHIHKKLKTGASALKEALIALTQSIHINTRMIVNLIVFLRLWKG